MEMKVISKDVDEKYLEGNKKITMEFGKVYKWKVEEKSPFGKRAPVQKQNSYHGTHNSWKQME
ncbi:hypothetical protein DOY81_008809 [Sarcophaga bullata]|nr:hypothetical protein DOY81_008809 [Sarcophaga bullata]